MPTDFDVHIVLTARRESAMRFAVGLVACATLLALVNSCFAQEHGRGTDAEVARGQEIAEKICWACHMVGPNSAMTPILRIPGPDFRAIAAREGGNRDEHARRLTSESELTAILQGTHPTENKPYAMPNPQLTNEMIDGHRRPRRRR
jgi:hypothetical protein